MPFFGCLRPSLSRSRLNRSRSSARSIEVDRGAEDRRARLLDDVGELQRRLPAELDDDALERPLLALLVEDGEHVLLGQRLEIEPVRRVVVGRNRLRIAVDHDRLEARLAQREGGVAAAIVELDALPDAVRPAAEDDDLSRGRSAPLRSWSCRRTASRRSNTCRRWAMRTRPRRCRCACRPAATPSLFRAAATSASVTPAERGEAHVGKARGLQGAQIAGVGRQAVSRAPCPPARRSLRSAEGTTGRSWTPRGFPRRSCPAASPGRP